MKKQPPFTPALSPSAPATETSHCLGCDHDFTYVPVLRKGGKWRSPKRQICDECRRSNTKKSKKNYVQSYQRGAARAEADHAFKGREGLASGVFKMSHREIAEALHISEETVADTERRVLLKIRNSAGLKELRDSFQSWLAEGCPVAESLEDPAALLIDYQMAVADYWVLHDKCARFVGQEEALECLKEITVFQGRIARFLEEMH